MVEAHPELGRGSERDRGWHGGQLLSAALAEPFQRAREPCRHYPHRLRHAHVLSGRAALGQRPALLRLGEPAVRRGPARGACAGRAVPLGAPPARCRGGGDLLPEHGHRPDTGARGLPGGAAGRGGGRPALLRRGGSPAAAALPPGRLEARPDLRTPIGVAPPRAPAQLPASGTRPGAAMPGDGHRRRARATERAERRRGGGTCARRLYQCRWLQ
mmetsp:Transcript_114565/g.355797  ORF Transcript_114565/g.355797 Transcript_114565/m.355797 type:complete len:215 (+) Transcript_114565:528-1172(+)